MKNIVKLIKSYFILYIYFSFQANTSIISLDASMNESIRDLTLNNKSVIKIDSNQSISEIGHELPALRVNNQVENSVYSSKTLLTTGLSSTVLSKTVKYLLSIFNDNIPNSTIIKRELVSELTIVKTALVQGYTNIIIIVSLIPGDPVGLTFIDLVAPFKTSVALSSFECLKYISIKDKIELPHLVIDYKHNYFNESDGNIIQFFSKIFPKRYGYNHDYSKTINISYCYNCPALKFEFNSAGLNFCITPPSNIMG